LRFNFSKGGLSSISVGGRGASFNIPVNRSGGPRTTVGLPGTGLSWSVEHTPDRAPENPTSIPAGPAAGMPNTRRLRPGQLDVLKQSLLGVLRQELFAPGSTGEQLWEHGLVSRLLADGSLGARTTGLLALIETPEALEGYVMRAQHPNGTAIEGEWEPVFAAIEACHEAVHAMGCPRIYTTVKINTRTDKEQTLEDKVASVRALL
jgi:uncharacterized protein (TIGR00106 family)